MSLASFLIAKYLLLPLFWGLCLTVGAADQDFSVLAWNVESDGSNPHVIASQLKELSGHTVYALSEVDGKHFETYRRALGESFQSFNGTHKDNDFLQMIFDSRRLELLQWTEMDEFQGIQLNQPDRAMRSPLLARFRDRQDGQEYQIVANHLARGNAESRARQARGLREWGRNQELPTIAIGDFNFDYDFRTRQGNASFVEFMRDDVWSWIKPDPLVDTNWYDPDGDGVDNYPDSMLDFAFVTGKAKTWRWTCRVIVRPGDFPDDDQTSDHRPILLRLHKK